MSQFFTDYHQARAAAHDLAEQCGGPVAIRKAREFNRRGFLVNLCCRHDADYFTSEIVEKGDPRSARDPA